MYNPYVCPLFKRVLNFASDTNVYCLLTVDICVDPNNLLYNSMTCVSVGRSAATKSKWIY